MPDIPTRYGSKIPVATKGTPGHGGDGKIHGFKVPFKNPNGKGISTEDQAQQIISDIEAMLTSNSDAKIAITYSANNDQSAGIIDAYTKPGGYTFDPGAGNQGAVFTIVAQQIQAKGWSDKVHILPISTCLHSGGVGAVSPQIVQRDAENIAKHLGAGWVTLGLQNQHTTGTAYSVGGGIANGVWTGSLKQSMDNALTDMTNGKIPPHLQAAYNAGHSNPNGLLMPKQHVAAPKAQTPSTTAASLKAQPVKPLPAKVPPASQPTDHDSEYTPEPPKPANPLSKKFADVAETFQSPPKPPIIAANDMSQYKWDKFKDSNDNFQFKKLDDSSEGYLGSIMSKTADEPLVNITKTGLQCLQLSDPSQKEEQTNAIVAGLQYMATNRTKDFNDPLIIEARGDFNVEQLQAIMKKLQKDKSPICFQENVKNSPEIKKLITEYNSEYTKTNSPTPQPTVPPEQLPSEPKKSSKPH